MNLARLKTELSLIIRDESLEPYFADWFNDAVEEIALENDLPGLRLLSPVNFSVNSSAWLYDPPNTLGAIGTIAITNGGTGYSEGDILTILQPGAAGGRLVVTEVAAGVVTAVQLVDGGRGYTTGSGKATAGGGNNDCTIQVVTLAATQVAFHKNLFQAADSLWRQIYICKRWEELDATDIDHDATGDHVTKIAVTEDSRKVGIYPMADETVKLWFYEKPTPMVDEDDEPECIPKEFRYRVIIPKVVIKNFKLLQDLMVQPPHQSLQWWTAEYHNGLHGTPRGEIGMLNYFAIRRKPRRHGGRQPLP